MKYGNEVLVPGSLWLHPKTGYYYIVIGPVTNVTNGESNGEDGVLYRSTNPHSPRLFYRKQSEFLDGRFILCREDGKPKE